MPDTNAAHAALRAAGYRPSPLKIGTNERWHRDMDGTSLIAMPSLGREDSVLQAFESGTEVTIRMPLTDLAARLPELERRTLAATRALRGEGE